jgi:hypothetical protein
MHKLFADWYGAVDLAPDPDVLRRRWECVENVSMEADPNAALNVVRAFLSLPDVTDEAVESFVAAFKAADPSFPLEKNTELVRVLLASCIANIVAAKGSCGLVASLALRAARCGGLRPSPEPIAVTREAEEFIASHGADVRDRTQDSAEPPTLERPDLEEADHEPTDLEETDDESTEEAEEPLTEQDLRAELAELRTAILALHSQAADAIEDLASRVGSGLLAVLKEETEVLWWLFSERSSDLDVPFSDLPQPGGALVIGRELSDRTHLIPPPPTAGSFLRKALAQAPSEPCSLTSVIDSLPSGWVATMPHGRHLGALTPVLLALDKEVEAGGSGWQSAFQNRSGLAPDQPLAPLEWARQLYDELSLLQAVDDA